MLETNSKLRNKGIGKSFAKTLEGIARDRGYTFIAAYHNDAELARFFLNRGFFVLDEIKDEYQYKFAEVRKIASHDKDDVFFTVYIVNPSDAGTYMRPERLHVSVEERIQYRQNRIDLYQTLQEMKRRVQLLAQQKGVSHAPIFLDRLHHQKVEQLAAIIEILDDLDGVLPTNLHFPNNFSNLKISELKDSGKDLLDNLQVFITYLQNHLDDIFANISSEQVKEIKEKLPDFN